MSNKQKNDFLKTGSAAFIEATNEILGLYDEHPSKTKITDEFSIILLEIYQNFMLDVLPSCQLLVDKQNFYSFAILCRSSLDIIIQIKWILSLNNEQRDQAISAFLNFEGIRPGKNIRKPYEWLSEFTKFTTRELAIQLKIDQEVINLPLPTHENKELNLTAFDYLSKITHWNPRLINDLVGFSQENHMGYTSEYLRMAMLALEVFIYCATMFTEIFMEQCLKLDGKIIKEKTQLIRLRFHQSFEMYSLNIRNSRIANSREELETKSG